MTPDETHVDGREQPSPTTLNISLSSKTDEEGSISGTRGKSVEVAAVNFGDYREHQHLNSDGEDEARPSATSNKTRHKPMIVYQGPINKYDNGAPEINGSNITVPFSMG
ncbi:hypothetical protein K3495_g14534 [Podosphaera aphanis]|nr:hypothetical protein K3495_g14534 [Podosphaera aphanis]